MSPADEQDFIDELNSHDYDKKIKDYDGVVGQLQGAFMIVRLQQGIEAQKKLIQNLDLANPSQTHEAESKGGAIIQKVLRNKQYMIRVKQLQILSDLYDGKS